MARGDFDTEHKADALRYCVVLGAVPYLDVDVASAIDLTSDEKVLTDIDVLGLQLEEDGSTRRLLFDCKGEKLSSKGSGPSPMSRSFWLAGLMAYVHADEGFVILRRRAEKAHRLSAQTLNVRLFDKPSFSAYAAAANPEYHLLSSYATSTEAWYRLMEGVNASGIGTAASGGNYHPRYLWHEMAQSGSAESWQSSVSIVASSIRRNRFTWRYSRKLCSPGPCCSRR
jgi:hypothetical protein